MIQNLKNIVFDMGNVLLEYNPERFLRTFIPEEPIRGALLRELFGGEEWRMSDAGAITDEEMRRAVTERIPEYAGQVQYALEHWHEDLRPIGGMAGLLGTLRDRGYRLYLLSNVSTRFHALKALHPFFEMMQGLIASADEKMVKPDPAIFELLLNRFQLQAGQCLFIDDNAENIESAGRCGLHAHLFTGEPELRAFLAEQGIL